MTVALCTPSSNVGPTCSTALPGLLDLVFVPLIFADPLPEMECLEVFFPQPMPSLFALILVFFVIFLFLCISVLPACMSLSDLGS